LRRIGDAEIALAKFSAQAHRATGGQASKTIDRSANPAQRPAQVSAPLNPCDVQADRGAGGCGA
jgi:hypothetical protein